MHADVEDPALDVRHDGGGISRLDGGNVFRCVADLLQLHRLHLNGHDGRALRALRLAAVASAERQHARGSAPHKQTRSQSKAKSGPFISTATNHRYPGPFRKSILDV